MRDSLNICTDTAAGLVWAACTADLAIERVLQGIVSAVDKIMTAGCVYVSMSPSSPALRKWRQLGLKN